MSTPTSFAAPLSLVLAGALGLAGCGTGAVPSSSAPAASPSSAAASATPDPAALAAYTDAMCPIFQAIVTIDPRIGDLRDAATDGGDLLAEAAEMTAVSEGLLVLLTDLQAVPQWNPGAALRHQLIISLHGIRAALLHVGRDPGAHDAADDITGMPFIATDALDRAMSLATQGGLTCEPAA